MKNFLLIFLFFLIIGRSEDSQGLSHKCEQLFKAMPSSESLSKAQVSELFYSEINQELLLDQWAYFENMHDAEIVSMMIDAATIAIPTYQFTRSFSRGIKIFRPKGIRPQLRQDLLDETQLLNQKRRELMNSLRDSTPLTERLQIQNALDSIDQRLIPLRIKSYSNAVDQSISQSAEHVNGWILVRSNYPDAIRRLAGGAIPKPSYLKIKSSRTWPTQGLVEYAQNSIANQTQVNQLMHQGLVSKIPYMESGKTAVIRDGQRVFTNTIQPGDDVIHVLANNKGRPFSSDIDPLDIITKKPKTITVDPHLGYVSDDSRAAIRFANEKLKSILGRNATDSRGIFPHGSAVDYPHTTLRDLEASYPLRGWGPHGEHIIIHRGPQTDPHKYLREFYNQLRSQGYQANPHPNWGI